MGEHVEGEIKKELNLDLESAEEIERWADIQNLELIAEMKGELIDVSVIKELDDLKISLLSTSETVDLRFSIRLDNLTLVSQLVYVKDKLLQIIFKKTMDGDLSITIYDISSHECEKFFTWNRKIEAPLTRKLSK